MAARQTMAQFIVECLTVSEKADLYGAKKCTGFSLVHVQGAQQVELRTIKIGATAHDPKALARNFEGTAENYGGGIPGTQQFVLLAFFDDQDSPQARYPFRKTSDPDHVGLGTEAPTNAGVTSQLMRHTEASNRISAHFTGELFRIMERQLDRLEKTNERLEREQIDTIELARTIIMSAAADRHTREIELLKVRQGLKDRDTITRLLPAVANKLTGREIFPQAVADTAVFEQLAETLTPEQVQKMASILQPEQWGMIADRLQKLLEAKIAREREEAEFRRKTEGEVTVVSKGNGAKAADAE